MVRNSTKVSRERTRGNGFKLEKVDLDWTSGRNSLQVVRHWDRLCITELFKVWLD